MTKTEYDRAHEASDELTSVALDAYVEACPPAYGTPYVPALRAALTAAFAERDAKAVPTTLMDEPLIDYAHRMLIAACTAWSDVRDRDGTINKAKCDLAQAQEDRLRSAINEIYALRSTSQPSPQQAVCTCPSGNGSLHWPCPVHPPAWAGDVPQQAPSEGCCDECGGTGQIFDATGDGVSNPFDCWKCRAARQHSAPRRMVTEADVERARSAMANNTKGRYLDNAMQWQSDPQEDMRAALESFAATRPPVEGAGQAMDAERLNWIHAQFYLGNIRINGLLPVGGENYCKDRLNSHIDAARSAQAAQGEGGK